jgi:hypothetical protein
MIEKPSDHGKHWNSDADALLVNLWREQAYDLPQLADKLARSVNGICGRLVKLELVADRAEARLKCKSLSAKSKPSAPDKTHKKSS